jgi:hypothetical protein
MHSEPLYCPGHLCGMHDDWPDDLGVAHIY